MSQYLPNIRQGEPYVIRLTYPAGVDLTGYQFQFALMAAFDTSPVLDVTTTAGDHADDDPQKADGPVVFLEIPENSINILVLGEYFYGLRRISPLGKERTLLPPTQSYEDKIEVIPASDGAQV